MSTFQALKTFDLQILRHSSMNISPQVFRSYAALMLPFYVYFSTSFVSNVKIFRYFSISVSMWSFVNKRYLNRAYISLK